MCQKRKLRNHQGSKSYFSKINISHDLLCPPFAGSNRKLQNYRILTEFFLNIAVHTPRVSSSPQNSWFRVKLTHSAWLSFTICSKDTLPALQINSLIGSVSTPLFKQQGRKRGEENCRSEVRGHIISRDLACRKRKTGWRFCRNPSHIILSVFIEGCDFPQHQTYIKCVVGHEGKIEEQGSSKSFDQLEGRLKR